MVSSYDTNTLFRLVNSIDRELENTEVRTSELEGRIRMLASVNGANVKENNVTVTNKRVIHKQKDKDTVRIEELERKRLELVMEIQKQDEITEKLREIIDSNKALYVQLKDALANQTESRFMLRDNMKIELEKYIKNNCNAVIDQLDLNIFNLFQNIHKLEDHLNDIIARSEKDDIIISSTEYQEKLNKLIKLFNEFFSEYASKQKTPNS